ncbi:MAG: hypothetical protein AAFU63_06295 [Pseudomonadota bacterium]
MKTTLTLTAMALLLATATQADSWDRGTDEVETVQLAGLFDRDGGNGFWAPVRDTFDDDRYDDDDDSYDDDEDDDTDRDDGDDDGDDD